MRKDNSTMGAQSGDDSTTEDSTAKTSGTDDKATDKTKTTGDGREPGAADLKTDDVAGLKKALAETRKERDGLVKAQRDAELARLPELERAQTEALQLKDENAKLNTENMRLKTALKLGLPWSLGKRLHGDTEEEMEADGADLFKNYNGDNRLMKDDKANKVRTQNDAKKTGNVGKPGMNEILRALKNG